MAQNKYTQWWMPLLEKLVGDKQPFFQATLPALRQFADASFGKDRREASEWHALLLFYGGLSWLDKTLAPKPEVRPVVPATRSRVKCRSRNYRRVRPSTTQFLINNPLVSKSLRLG